jgi:hypothetical protein
MLRDSRPADVAPSRQAGSDSTWVIGVAALHARRQGVRVRVVLPRAPGVVVAVREIADTYGVDVTTTIASTSIIARFEGRATIGANAPESAIAS